MAMKRRIIDKYRRDGTPYPPGNKGLFEWAKDIEDNDKKRVGYKEFWWGGRVSTVWLGLDHSFSMSSKPLIFETMVFPRNDYGELDMERYSTEEEAIQGHKRMVLKWFIPFGLLSRILSS